MVKKIVIIMIILGFASFINIYAFEHEHLHGGSDSVTVDEDVTGNSMPSDNAINNQGVSEDEKDNVIADKKEERIDKLKAMQEKKKNMIEEKQLMIEQRKKEIMDMRQQKLEQMQMKRQQRMEQMQMNRIQNGNGNKSR